MKTFVILRFQNFRLLNPVDDLWAHAHDLLFEPILNHLVLGLEDLELLVRDLLGLELLSLRG
jgi:hypothetical protein